jgi:hypothetical protein
MSYVRQVSVRVIKLGMTRVNVHMLSVNVFKCSISCHRHIRVVNRSRYVPATE